MDEPRLALRTEAQHEQRAFQFTEERIAEAMAIAVKRVMTDKEVIAAVGALAFEVLQQRAAATTGNWLLRTARAFLSRWLVVGLIVILAAKYMGLPAALHLLTGATEKVSPQ